MLLTKKVAVKQAIAHLMLTQFVITFGMKLLFMMPPEAHPGLKVFG